MKIKQLIIYYRVGEWFYFLSFIILGYLIGLRSQDSEINIVSAIGIIVMAALYLAHGYALNDLCDGDFIKRGASTFKEGIYFSLVPVLLSIVIALLVASPILLIILGIGIISSFLYSCYPFRLKRITIIELILNSLCFTVVYFFGLLINNSLIKTHEYAVGGAIFILMMLYQLAHEIEDMEEDKLSGTINNTAISLGMKGTFWTVVCLCGFFIIYLLYIIGLNIIGFACFLITTIFCICFIRTLYIFIKEHNFPLKKRLRSIGAGYGLIMFILAFVYFHAK